MTELQLNSLHSIAPALDRPIGDDLVWEVSGIAGEIGRTKRQTHHLLDTNALPARKVGGRWCASRKALRAFFATVTAVA